MTHILRPLYETALKQCRDTVHLTPESAAGGPTNPLVIAPPKDYAESGLKIMYFGQETNGWEGSFRDGVDLDALLHLYDGFSNNGGGFKYGGQFWNALRSFQASFKEYRSDSIFIWNNLVKIGKDWSKGIPPAEVLSWQEPWFEVIRREVDLLRPDVVIFLSGPNYDWVIEHIFGKVDLSSVEDYSTRQLARVHSHLLPSRSFRTYHPGYLWRFDFHGVRDAIMVNSRSESGPGE